MASYAPIGPPVGVRLTELSSSLTIGFYLRDRDEWEEWVSDMQYACSAAMHCLF